MDQLPYSPAARAFFAALDNNNNNNNNDPADQDTATVVDPEQQLEGEEDTTARPRQPPVSSWIQKRIQTLGWRNRYSQTEQYPVQIGDFDFSVRQVQRGEIEGTYGTGATVWPASMVLIKYLQHIHHHHPPVGCLLRGRRILELGAGTGVVSVAAALLGASYCVCTDGEDAVVQLARDNINATAALPWNEHQHNNNNVDDDHSKNVDDDHNNNSPTETRLRDCTVPVQTYWWGKSSDLLLQQHGPFDVILVSDCVLPKLYPIAPLVQALDELLPPLSQSTAGDTGAVALLSYEHRYYPDYHPKDKFAELCRQRNLQVETIPPEQQDPVYSTDDIEIWRVQRR